MKKISNMLVLLLAVLVCMTFFSCEQASVSDSTVMASIGSVNKVTSRTLSDDSQSYDEKTKDELFWFYTATKTDGQFSTGATSSWTKLNGGSAGLPTSFGPFSKGSWTFVFNAYTENEVNEAYLYYEGSESAVTLDDSNTSVIIKVEPVQQSGTTGTIVVRGLSAGTIDTSALGIVIQLDMYDGTTSYTIDTAKASLTSAGLTLSGITAGYNQITIYLVDSSDLSGYDNSSNPVTSVSGMEIKAQVSSDSFAVKPNLYSYITGSVADGEVTVTTSAFSFYNGYTVELDTDSVILTASSALASWTYKGFATVYDEGSEVTRCEVDVPDSEQLSMIRSSVEGNYSLPVTVTYAEVTYKLIVNVQVGEYYISYPEGSTAAYYVTYDTGNESNYTFRAYENGDGSTSSLPAVALYGADKKVVASDIEATFGTLTSNSEGTHTIPVSYTYNGKTISSDLVLTDKTVSVHELSFKSASALTDANIFSQIGDEDYTYSYKYNNETVVTENVSFQGNWARDKFEVYINGELTDYEPDSISAPAEAEVTVLLRKDAKYLAC